MIVLGRKLRVRYVLGNEEAFFLLRCPTTSEIVKFNTSRFSIVPGGKIENTIVEASCDFFDTICEGMEGLFWDDGSGDAKPLTTEIPDWKAKIPAFFKVEVATVFQGNRAELTTDEKKSSGPT